MALYQPAGTERRQCEGNTEPLTPQHRILQARSKETTRALSENDQVAGGSLCGMGGEVDTKSIVVATVIDQKTLAN